MNIQENVELNTFSTFMVSATARYFTTISSVDEIHELVSSEVWKDNSRYILGEGSNTLFIGNINALVVKNNISGLEITKEDSESISLRVGAGENWHSLVLFSVDQKLWGIENLVLIPGTVGASPVQNIGAYGVEVSETIISVECINVETNEREVLMNRECLFGYRDSIFKKNPDKYIITHVNFSLSKKANPVLNYDRIHDELESKENLSSQMIADAITCIRDTKLPRVGELGTAGSFFKNPIVSKKKAAQLLVSFPGMKQFNVPNGVKLSAAWLIEYVGLKGISRGPVGTYDKHALVLVNHGGATGLQVQNFALSIIKKVEEVFNVSLEPEINIIT